MSSLSASTANWAPSLADDTATDPALAALERLRRLLRVDTACITRLCEDGPRLVAATGVTELLSSIVPFQSRAAGLPEPVVMADTAKPGPIRFYAAIPLPAAGEGPSLLLNLCDRRPRSRAMAHRLAAIAIDVTSRATIERQASQITRYRARAEYVRRQFDRASATAKIGIWECNLADNSLTWTNGVYDLFDVPRGSPVSREQTIACYTEASRTAMQAARAHAIATCTEFNLDVEIVTAKGNRRWMRLTGAVEAEDGVAVRIFGMKQDITEEKLLADRTRYLAEYDVMTGLANRSQFQNRLGDLAGARYGRPIAGLLLVDLDGFKQVNDTHGHALGDECLKEAAQRLTECCGNAELVARIGGDEFAVLLGPGLTQGDIEAIAEAIVGAMSRPLLRQGRTIALGASVGVAHHDGGSAEDLFRHADIALYAAKGGGRNTSRIFGPRIVG